MKPPFLLPPDTLLPEGSAKRLEPIEYELLHTVTQRALRQMLDGAHDRAALLARLRHELAVVLGGGAEGTSRQDLLLAEFETVLARLEATQLSQPGAAPPEPH